MNLSRLIWITFVLICVGCGQDNGLGGAVAGNPGEDIRNADSAATPPPLGDSWTDLMINTACEVLSGLSTADSPDGGGCFSDLDRVTCRNAIRVIPLNEEIGLPAGQYLTADDVVQAEAYGVITANRLNAWNCIRDLRDLRCDDPIVTQVYNPEASGNLDAIGTLFEHFGSSCARLLGAP